MNALSIDPGLEGTGVSLWSYHGRKVDWQRLELPIATWTYIPRGRDWTDRAADCLTWLNYIYRVYAVTDTWVEWPQYFGDAKGHAATVEGSIHKLTYLIGGMGHLATQDYGGNLTLVPVLDWKGQLPKDVVIQRIIKLYVKNHLPIHDHHVVTHGWDALGIGLYAKGIRL